MSPLSVYQECQAHLTRGQSVAYQEGAEEDERDEVDIGQVSATALTLVLP